MDDTDTGAATPDLSRYPEGDALQSAAASQVEQSLVNATAQASAMALRLGSDSSNSFSGEDAPSVVQRGAEPWSLLGAVTTATADTFSDAVSLGAAEAAEMATGSVSAVASSLQPLVDSAPESSHPRLVAPPDQSAAEETNPETSPSAKAMLTAHDSCGDSKLLGKSNDERQYSSAEEEDHGVDEDAQKEWLDAQEEADIFTCARSVPAGHRYRVRLDKASNGSFGLTVKLYRHWGVVVHALPRSIVKTESSSQVVSSPTAHDSERPGTPPVSSRGVGQEVNPAARAGVLPGDVLVAVGTQSAFPTISTNDDHKDEKKGAELANAMRSLGELLLAAPGQGAVLTFDRPKQRELLAASPSEPPRFLGFENESASSSSLKSLASSRSSSSVQMAPLVLVRRLAVAWRPALRTPARGSGGSFYNGGRPAKSRALAALLQAHGAVSTAEALVLSAQLACLEQRTTEWAARGAVTLPLNEAANEDTSGGGGRSIGGQAPPQSTSLVSRLLSPTRVMTGGFFSSSSSSTVSSPLAVGSIATIGRDEGDGAGADDPSFVGLSMAADKLEQPPEAWRMRRTARKRSLLQWFRRESTSSSSSSSSSSAADGQRLLLLRGVRRALSVRIVGTLSQAPTASSTRPERGNNSGSAFHTAYIVFVADAESGTQWTVNRRFSEFRTLEQSLADCWPDLRKILAPDFPARRGSHIFETIPGFAVQDRRQKLEKFMRRVASLLLPGWHSYDTAAVAAAMEQSSSINPLDSTSSTAAGAGASAAAMAVASSEACVGGLLHPGAADAVKCVQAFLDAGERRFGPLPLATTSESAKTSPRARIPAVLVATSAPRICEDLPASSSSSSSSSLPHEEPPSPLKPPSEPPSPQPAAPPSSKVSAETAATLSIDDVEVLLLARRIAALEVKVLAEHPRLVRASERVDQLQGALTNEVSDEGEQRNPRLLVDDRREQERDDTASSVPPLPMHDWSGETADASDESMRVAMTTGLAVVYQAATAAGAALSNTRAAVAGAAVDEATGAGGGAAQKKNSMGLSLDTSWVPAGHFTFDLETGAGVGLSKTLRVTRVDLGSDAARAGVAKGFRLVSFDGAAVTTLEAFKEALQHKRNAQSNAHCNNDGRKFARGYSVEFERPAARAVGARKELNSSQTVPNRASSSNEHVSDASPFSNNSQLKTPEGIGESSGLLPQHQPHVPPTLKQRRSAKAAATKAKTSMQRAAQVVACRVLTLPALNGLIETFLQSLNDDDAVGAAATKAAAAAAAETTSDLAGGRSDDEDDDRNSRRKQPVACAAATTLTFLAQFMNWMSSAVAEGCRDFLKAEVERAGVQKYRLKLAASAGAASSSTTSRRRSRSDGHLTNSIPLLLLPEEDEASWAEVAADAAVDGVRRAVEIEVFVPAARTLRRRLRAAEDRENDSILHSSSGNGSSRSGGSSSGKGASTAADRLQRAYDVLGRSPGNIGPRGGQAKLGLPPEHRSPSGWEPVADLLAGLDYRRGAVLPLDQLALLAQAGDEIGRTFTREAPLRAAKAAAAARVAAARARQEAAENSEKARRSVALAAVVAAPAAAGAAAAETMEVPPAPPVSTSANDSLSAAAAAGFESTAQPRAPLAPPTQEVLGADSILPVFIFALARARVANLGGLVQTLTALIAPQHRVQAAGYYLATLQAAYDVLASFEDDETPEMATASMVATDE